jgi:hypothetical protein
MGGVEIVDSYDLELASFSFGEDEADPAYERTSLYVTPAGDFYIIGGGGPATAWGKKKGNSRDFDVGRIPISMAEAVGWINRCAPAAFYWAVLIIRAQVQDHACAEFCRRKSRQRSRQRPFSHE